MIPKIIIYIWFGRGKKNDLIIKCQKKNSQILDGWKFVEYTEDSFNINSCLYAKQAYEKKKYAFASDYARFEILYKYGGIYVDTDVEFVKKIPNDFLCLEGFTGIESNNKIAPGLVFAVEPGNEIVKEILESYQNDVFIMPDGKLNLLTVVDRVTNIFRKHGFKLDGKEQLIDGIKIYPFEYFCAFDFITRDFNITDNTYSIHHYAATWVSEKQRINRAMKECIKNLIGKKRYKNLVLFKRKVFGIKK